MPALPLYQVDAFTDRPFAGNPAAVCPLAAPLPDALMQDIAAENNLSETAFFHPRGDGGFALRWFTPTTEVDLCGHATLASGHVLMRELEPARAEAVFHTRSGALTVRRDGDLLVMDLPLYRPEPASAEVAAVVAAALGARPAEVLRARALLAVFAGAAEVRALRPDMAALGRLDTTLCVTGPGAGEAPAAAAGEVDFVSRYFAPTFGVPEDPVTGSAHCMLAPYWAARLGKRTLVARQVSRRGGELRCEIAGPGAGDRVLVAGQSRLVIKGTISF